MSEAERVLSERSAALAVLLERIARERANATDALVVQCLDRIEGKR